MTRKPTHLTPAMRAALRHGSRKGGVHVGTGRQENGEPAPPKRVTKPVMRKLVALGYAVHHGEVLLTVKAGHAELAKPIQSAPVYLRQRDGLTTRRELSVRDEDEVQDADELKGHWRDDAEIRRGAASDIRDQARRLADRARRVA